MRYDITLKIDYTYEYAAAQSRHIVRLIPTDSDTRQRLVASNLTIVPTPDEWINREDFFDNKCVELAFLKAHKQLQFSVQARVERFEMEYQRVPSNDLAGLKNEIVNYRYLGADSPLHCIASSVRAPLTTETSEYARVLIKADTPVLDIIADVGSAIFRDFKFDPKATTVETPMLEAFHGKRGVCQDFAHIMISCLRGVGIPAAYVSGLLRTTPPKGKPRLEGADAMHAWISAWCGNQIGWVEYDPTNNVFVGSDHIVIARGRDYFDVAPVKGIMRTSGGHKSKQSVDVITVD